MVAVGHGVLRASHSLLASSWQAAVGGDLLDCVLSHLVHTWPTRSGLTFSGRPAATSSALHVAGHCASAANERHATAACCAIQQSRHAHTLMEWQYTVHHG
jgi:hypothetical protein